MFLPGVLRSIWGGPVKHLVECLGVELDEVRERHETRVTPTEIDCDLPTDQVHGVMR